MTPSGIVRLRSLDGLRGLAALSVVFCHALLPSTVFYAALYSPAPAGRWSLTWFLTRPPFDLIWAGQQAVMVFFVLSGLVVTLPFIHGKGRWFGYYPRRFIRLYLPTWGAVMVAVILAELFRRHAVAGASPWLNEHLNPNWAQVKPNLTLYRRTTSIDGPLWSLRWEVIFSALLPVYVLFGRVGRRGSLAKIVVMLALLALGAGYHHESLRYLPVFGIGAAIAGDLESVERLKAWTARHRVMPWLVLVLAAALIDVPAFVALNSKALTAFQARAELTAVPLGAALLVVLAMVASPVRAACDSKPVQWLGTQSFSLYLIHEPIVVSVALALGANTPVGEIVAISVPLALAGSWCFQRAVEGPAHRLSQVVGRSVNGLVTPRRQPLAIHQVT